MRAMGISIRPTAPFPYTAETRYRFRLVVDVAQHTYSIFVRPEGGTEQTLATNYAVRTSQQDVPSLDTWALMPSQGTLTVANFTLGLLSTVSWQDFFATFSGAGSPRAIIATFAAIPHQDRMTGLTGLAPGPVDSVGDLAVIVRFNSLGRIDVRDGDRFAADRVFTYTAGVRYEFRIVVDNVQHTYTVFVKPEGGVEQTLATDYAFRTAQQSADGVNTWALRAPQGSHTADSFNVTIVPE
jgi:hypothetical protein